jgi:HEPN superfamily AbiV-like protein
MLHGSRNKAVASEVLLLGSLYALEQCGHLLIDAITLIENKRYPTAAGLALLAKEEIGRHGILLDHWRAAGDYVATRDEVILLMDVKGCVVRPVGGEFPIAQQTPQRAHVAVLRPDSRLPGQVALRALRTR